MYEVLAHALADERDLWSMEGLAMSLLGHLRIHPDTTVDELARGLAMVQHPAGGAL